MATDYEQNHPPLRNPLVDYERADLSARGILLFLAGLLVAGVFIELVIWGMFHFLARSEALFPSGTVSPLMSAQQRAVREPEPGSILQNTPSVNMSVFPEPRLQVNDAGDMQAYLRSEQGLLNAAPFTDTNGAVHIPITLAMQLIEQRGLPTRPNAPPPEINLQTESGNPALLHEVPGPLTPGGAGEKPGKTAGAQPKQP
jgi:hypothetical protein